jgi:hypothetical protein
LEIINYFAARFDIIELFREDELINLNCKLLEGIIAG